MVEINIELDDEVKSYSFPTDWSEVTIEQFSRLYTINKEIHTGMFYTFEVIHQLTGIDSEIIEQINYEDFSKIVELMKFIYEPIEEKNNQFVLVDGEEYYLNTEFNNYTAGEIISLEVLLQSVNNDMFKIMPELLCIFLRKKKENGKLEKYKTSFMERKEKFKNIKIDEINHIFTFFLRGRDSSPNNTTVSSEVK
jgi:hypothetical protein